VRVTICNADHFCQEKFYYLAHIPHEKNIDEYVKVIDHQGTLLKQ